MKSKLPLSLLVLSLSLVACTPKVATPTQPGLPKVPEPDEQPEEQIEPDPLFTDNLNQALEAVEILEELGVE